MISRQVLRFGAACVAGLAASSAYAGGQANNDVVKVKTSSGPVTLDVLANDDPGSAGSRLAIVSVTPPSHGTLTIAPGRLNLVYTPTPGFSGVDSFQYTATNAMQTVDVPRFTIATVTGTPIFDGFGSALAPVPGFPNDYYTMTDRGPNVDGPNGGKVFALGTFTPQIARYHLSNGTLTMVGSPILLRDAAGNPRTGLPRPVGVGATGEVPYDNNGNILPPDPTGLDSEGLVALADGTFWVSDEYGPFVTHFAADGTTIEELSPFATNAQGHKLPAVLGTRLVNKGMEGLTIVPSGKMLVGNMQASLVNGVSASDGGKSPIIRIVTYDLINDATHTIGATHQYLYMLDSNSPTVSEMTAISETEFYMDERDGKFPADPGGASTQKKLYRISLVGATDVTAAGDPAAGLTFSGKTLEQLTNKQTAVAAAATLSANGVICAGTGTGTNNTKTLAVDLLAEFANLGALGTFYPHDKVEGVALIDGGRRLVISNDDDFGVTAGSTAFSVVPKILPAVPGLPTDFTQFLFVDLNNLPATTTTAFVQVTISPNAPAGRLVLSRSTYAGVPSSVTVGLPLPGSGTKLAVADGTYPGVFANEAPDPSFGITSPILLDRYDVSGATATASGTFAVPTSQVVTSFPSKSELGLNLSTDGKRITFMGYGAPINALDVSNSNTTGHVDPTNPVSLTYPRAVAQIDANATTGFLATPVNAYSGNNGRAAILDSVGGQYFLVGNAGNGSGTQPLVIVNNTGVQLALPGGSANTTVVGQQQGTIGAANGFQFGFSIAQLGLGTDKSGKDDNFRGVTIFNNTLYVTKGSGSNGINTVYRVGNAGTLPTTATASSTAFGVLPGFSTTLARSTTGVVTNPFGMWFANANTLYVADEGSGASGANPNAGLQKWVFQNDGLWHNVYTLQNGLNRGTQYSVFGYASSLNPSTDGLRNLSGVLNGDGTVTIYAVTSTISAQVDQGADPNRLVAITDNLSFGTAAQAIGEQFTTLRTAEFGEVLRGVCFVQQFAPGDVGRHGGAPTAADVQLLQRIVLGTMPIPLGMTVADLDFNRNGVVDSGDTVLLMYFILGRIPYLPYP